LTLTRRAAIGQAARRQGCHQDEHRHRPSEIVSPRFHLGIAVWSMGGGSGRPFFLLELDSECHSVLPSVVGWGRTNSHEHKGGLTPDCLSDPADDQGEERRPNELDRAPESSLVKVRDFDGRPEPVREEAKQGKREGSNSEGERY
jgi:hypothetical protein